MWRPSAACAERRRIDEAGFSSLLGHFSFLWRVDWGDTPRVLYGSENKGVARQGIRKYMKTKVEAGGQAGKGISNVMKTNGRQRSKLERAKLENTKL
jgi:hypothetical protein